MINEQYPIFTVSAETASSNLKLAPSRRIVFISSDNRALDFQNASAACIDYNGHGSW